MSDVVLRTAVTTRVAVYSASQRLETAARNAVRALREDTGQDLLEYAGVLAIIALIIGALFATHFWQTVATTVTNTVSSIINGHGSSSSK